MAAQITNHCSPRTLLLCRVMLLNAFVLVTACANAAVIDFETTPGGGAPTDDLSLPISSPYVFPGLNINFGIDGDSNGVVETNAVFEHAGLDLFEPPNGGFSGSAGTDTADAGFTAQLGNFFMRGPTGGADFGLFVITYSGSTLVTAASGEIWDIDGTALAPGGTGNTEEYTVRAYDSANNLIATQVSPLGVLTSAIAPLDGRPWVFSFTGLSAGIAKITIDFTGTKPAGIGLAFNNFNPTGVIPEPTTFLLLAQLACVALLSSTRRQTTKRHNKSQRV